jgi:hypothetical protein
MFSDGSGQQGGQFANTQSQGFSATIVFNSSKREDFTLSSGFKKLVRRLRSSESCCLWLMGLQYSPTVCNLSTVVLHLPLCLLSKQPTKSSPTKKK